MAEDFDRIFDHIEEHEVGAIPSRIDEIIQAISVLEFNPLIGRPVREDGLVTGRRARGYVALYRYISEIDTVFVLAVRGQKEAGYNG